MSEKPTVLITGVSGSLGLRLLDQLPEFHIIGAGRHEPPDHPNLPVFEKLDLAEERSCDQLLALLRRHRPEALVHLAFCSQPIRESRGRERMWQTNVAGTGRVLEALAEHNRSLGTIDRFVYPSSATVYGTDAPKPVSEETPLAMHAFPFAQDKREVDLAIQARARSLRDGAIYLLRPQPYAGESARNILIGNLRGIPQRDGRLAERLRRKNSRLPVLLPSGEHYLEHKSQFVHLDDMARLIVHILRRKRTNRKLTVMNVAGRGDPLSLRSSLQIAKAGLKRVPGRILWKQSMLRLWDLGLSDVPPEALPHLLGSLTVDTSRLRIFLGEDHRSVIHFTSQEALAASFAHRTETKELAIGQ
jgi:nucleoside-diphosphate-sugar epimerase